MLLQLHGGGVDHQPGRHGGHVLNGHQAVLPQGGPGLHNIHDSVSQIQNRGQLHAALNLDDLHVHPLLLKEAAGHIGILGGDAARLVGAIKVGPLLYRQGKAAAAEAQIQHLIEGAPLLQDRILAHHTQIAHPVLHIGNDVRRFGQHRVQRIIGQGVDQTAAGIFDGRTVQAHPFQQLHRLVLEAPLGQGNAQSSLRLSRCALTVGQGVHVHSKSDGGGRAAESAQQVVVPPSGEHGGARPLRIAPEDHPGIVVNLVYQSQIKADKVPVPRLIQHLPEIPQVCQLRAGPHQGLGLVQHLCPAEEVGKP